MTKTKIRIFCIIAFIILPLIIIIPGLISLIKFQISFHTDSGSKYDTLSPETQSGHLIHNLNVKDDDYVYSIYCLEFDSKTSVKRIAFRASSEEEIKQTINESYLENMKTAYWEGDCVIMDFTETDEYINYREKHYITSYSNGATLEEVYSNVPVYDLSSYIGEEEDEESVFKIIFLGIVNILTSSIMILRIFVPLAIELIIALILKLTIFKIKKESM